MSETEYTEERLRNIAENGDNWLVVELAEECLQLRERLKPVRLDAHCTEKKLTMSTSRVFVILGSIGEYSEEWIVCICSSEQDARAVVAALSEDWARIRACRPNKYVDSGHPMGRFDGAVGTYDDPKYRYEPAHFGRLES